MARPKSRRKKPRSKILSLSTFTISPVPTMSQKVSSGLSLIQPAFAMNRRRFHGL